MFIGHFALALAARRPEPGATLGWLFAACQLPDLIWPLLLLTGVERARIAPGDTAFTPLAFDAYPWSHSLVMVVVAGVALGALHHWRHRSRPVAATIVLLVVSHWVLDWVTHRPDLPLVPGSDGRYGLGLWNSVPATLVVEVAMFALGAWRYSRATVARDRTGRYALGGLIGFLAAIHVANAFGPPPPNMTAVAIGGLSIWLLVSWAGWADAHRAPREAVAAR